MEIIDCHTNIGWDAGNLRKNLIPAEQLYTRLLEKMDAYGISRAVILPFPSPRAKFDSRYVWYDIENQYLLASSIMSDRFIVFPGVNPGQKESVSNIKVMAMSSQVKGVKFSHQNSIKFPIEKLIDNPLMKIIHDNNLALMIHTGTGKEPGTDIYHTTLDYGLKVAKKYPDINFIFCHLGRLHTDLFEALQMPNVYMDTSALSLAGFSSSFVARDSTMLLRVSRPREIIEILVKEGYENKLVFGSDEPYTQLNNEISYVDSANISMDSKRKIFSKNLMKLLR